MESWFQGLGYGDQQVLEVVVGESRMESLWILLDNNNQGELLFLPDFVWMMDRALLSTDDSGAA